MCLASLFCQANKSFRPTVPVIVVVTVTVVVVVDVAHVGLPEITIKLADEVQPANGDQTSDHQRPQLDKLLL